LWVDLVEKGYASPEIVNYGFGDIPGQFMAGNAAMMINGPWVLNSLASEAPDLEFTVAMLPIPEGGQPGSALGGENFTIFASSKAQDCAWDFIMFTQAPDNIEKWYKGLGFLPARADVAETSDYWKSDPHLAVFVKQMETAMPRGPLPNWPDVSEVVQLMLQEALTGQVSVDEAITSAAQQIGPMLPE
jgi:multiple sugar transport system substrate-binding protein